MPSEIDVVIVGAGAAGLSAAKSAATHGLSFVLLEASHRIGGRARTEDFVPGQLFDLGCHWMHSASINPLRRHRESGRIPPSWKTTAAREVPLGIHNKISILLNAASPALPDPQFLTVMTRDHDVPVALNLQHERSWLSNVTCHSASAAVDEKGRNLQLFGDGRHRRRVPG